MYNVKDRWRWRNEGQGQAKNSFVSTGSARLRCMGQRLGAAGYILSPPSSPLARETSLGPLQLLRLLCGMRNLDAGGAITSRARAEVTVVTRLGQL